MFYFIFFATSKQNIFIMYKVTFYILDKDNNEVIRSFSNTSFTNVLVYLGDMSWSLKTSGLVFRVVVHHLVKDSSTIVFSFIHTDL